MEYSNEWLILGVFAGIFGAMFGSFVTMASYRLPRNEDIVFAPSHCTSCNHRLGVKDLFPIISWLINKGRCAYCKSKVSSRYPMIEVVMSTLFVLVYIKAGVGLVAFSLYAMVILLMIMIVTDLEHKIIPDEVQLGLIPVGMLYWYAMELPLQHIIWGPLLGLGFSVGIRWIFFLWKKRECLGMGDVKFFTVAGIILGLKAFAPFLFLSGFIGIIISVIWKLKGKGEEFPFGPALAVAMFLCVMWPEYFVDPIYRGF